MQPTCKQVPPRKGSFSTTMVFSPSSPARIAATYPPGPLPIIATSYLATRSLPSVGPETGEGSAFSPQSRSKNLEGIRPKRPGARRTKSRPRLQRRRRRSSEFQILAAAFRPRNRARTDAYLGLRIGKTLANVPATRQREVLNHDDENRRAPAL